VAPSANAYAPDSPEVKKLVRKAVNYLSSSASFSDEQRVLVAYALLKADEPESHRVVQAARRDCVDWCRSEEMIAGRLDSIYEIAVVGLFFCELDPALYKPQIKLLIKELEKRQKSFGAWGYPEGTPDWETGDTSMTQYAILFAWTAKSVGAAEISKETMRGATNWLLRTQDPSGAWSYQGKDPASFNRIAQDRLEIRHSLSTAGVGSLYICSGLLGFTNDQVDREVIEDPDIPPALTLVVSKSGKTVATRTKDQVINESILKRGIKDGDKWFYKNYQINPPEYTAYYLYILERYKSFKDVAEGKRPKEPSWYNDGVRLLMQKQSGFGAWDLDGGNGRSVDTAFSLLFLLRITQKAIAKQSDAFGGLLVAGRGIPQSGQMRMRNGQIVGTPFQGSTSVLLEILEDESHPDFDALTRSSMRIASDPKARAIQEQQMRRLVRGESYEARMMAVQTLSKICNLDNVPSLIYALSDPDLRVSLAARDGLRFISRKFQGFGLKDNPSKSEILTVVQKWKDWYLEIRPDARFED